MIGGIDMGKKTTVLFISITFAFIMMSAGYGKWQRELTIEGTIKVIPDPDLLEEMEVRLQDMKIAEEDREEERPLLDIEKAAEVQKSFDEVVTPKEEQQEEHQEGQVYNDIE